MERPWGDIVAMVTMSSGIGDERGFWVTESWERPPASFFSTAGGQAVGVFAILLLVGVIAFEGLTAYQMTVALNSEIEPGGSSGAIQTTGAAAAGAPSAPLSKDVSSAGGRGQAEGRHGKQCDQLFQTVLNADARSISSSIDAFKGFCDLTDDQRLSLTSRLASLQSVVAPQAAPPPSGPSPAASAAVGQPPGVAKAEAAAAAVSQLPPQAVSFRVYGNVDMYGGDLGMMRDVERVACEDACRGEGRCVAYSYDSWNKACYLKNEIKEVVVDARSVTAVRSTLPVPTTSRKPIVFETIHNAAFPNEAVEQRSARSFDECEGLCGKSASCVAVTYVKVNRTCQMFSAPQKYVARPGSESATKTQ